MDQVPSRGRRNYNAISRRFFSLFFWKVFRTAAAMADVQQIIERIGSGEANAEELLPLIYDELRTLAHSRLAREAGESLQTTELVHDKNFIG